jgi:hypothetical protein
MAIWMTAYAADDLIQQGITEGIQIVLAKPLDINFLLCHIIGNQWAYYQN